jgi:hypothetical protein
MKFDRRSAMGVGLFATLVTCKVSSAVSATNSEIAMSQRTIEIVSFRLVNETSEQDFLKAIEATNNFLKSQKGFISRRLSKDDAGNFFDHVEWATLDDAKVAMESSMQKPELLPFLQMIDPASIKLFHNKLMVSIA